MALSLCVSFSLLQVNHLSKRHPDMKIEEVPELTLPIIKPNRDYFCQYCDKVKVYKTLLLARLPEWELRPWRDAYWGFHLDSKVERQPHCKPRAVEVAPWVRRSSYYCQGFCS